MKDSYDRIRENLLTDDQTGVNLQYIGTTTTFILGGRPKNIKNIRKSVPSIGSLHWLSPFD